MSIEQMIGELAFEPVCFFYDCEIEQAEVHELHDLLRQLWDAGLEPLVKRLAESREGDSFRDTMFEVLAAKKFIECGATLKYEPPEYGMKPPDFRADIEGVSALVECTHPSDDWYEQLRGRIESRLKKTNGASVVLRIPEPVSSHELDEERLIKEVVCCAKDLQSGSSYEGKILDGMVEVRISRKPCSGRTQVHWDFDEMCWAAPTALLFERVEKLVKKAENKFGELSKQRVGDILRVFLVHSYGAPGILRPHWLRAVLNHHSVRECFERYLDGIVFASRANQRIVEQVRFEETFVLTPEPERQGRLARFFAELGVAGGSP